AVVVVAVAVVLLLRSRREAPRVDASPAPNVIVSPAPLAAERALVTLNALPWARLKLQPRGAVAASGAPLTLTTPRVVELPVGAYTVELENGGITPPLTREIEVARGAQNEFVFTMPSFDPASAARLAVEQGP